MFYLTDALNSNQSSPKQMVQIRPQLTYLNDSSNTMNSPNHNNNDSLNGISSSTSLSASHQQQQQTTSNLSAEITEKMRLLENIQKQLRIYQVN